MGVAVWTTVAVENVAEWGYKDIMWWYYFLGIGVAQVVEFGLRDCEAFSYSEDWLDDLQISYEDPNKGLAWHGHISHRGFWSVCFLGFDTLWTINWNWSHLISQIWPRMDDTCKLQGLFCGYALKTSYKQLK